MLYLGSSNIGTKVVLRRERERKWRCNTLKWRCQYRRQHAVLGAKNILFGAINARGCVEGRSLACVVGQPREQPLAIADNYTLACSAASINTHKLTHPQLISCESNHLPKSQENIFQKNQKNCMDNSSSLNPANSSPKHQKQKQPIHPIVSTTTICNPTTTQL